MIAIYLLGQNGRMGKTVKNWVAAHEPDIKLCESPYDAEIILDFSSPKGVIDLAKKISNQKHQAWVVGSTGWTTEQKQTLEVLLNKHPVLIAANFSLGIALLQECLKTASQLKSTEVEIYEAHHIHKRDRPSGTALAILDSLNSLGIQNPKMNVVREAEIIGDHSVTFKNLNESITITHNSINRELFAQGAIHACRWIAKKIQKNPTLIGRFSIADTLNRSI